MSISFNINDYNSYHILSIDARCKKYICSTSCVHEVCIEIEESGTVNEFITGEQIAKYYSFHSENIPDHFSKYIDIGTYRKDI
jgi:hypothetical protein